ncbi:MAG: molybdopterin dinucleotide binding domain-containing protein [Adlercreutzia sp.]
MSERPRYRVHSQWFSTPLLRELDPEPYVKINPADAEARGISDRRLRRVLQRSRLRCCQGGVFASYSTWHVGVSCGWQLSQHKAGGWSELSSTGSMCSR